MFLLDRFTTCVANARKCWNIYFPPEDDCRAVYFQVMNFDPGNKTIFLSALVLKELDSAVLRNVLRVSLYANQVCRRTYLRQRLFSYHILSRRYLLRCAVVCNGTASACKNKIVVGSVPPRWLSRKSHFDIFLLARKNFLYKYCFQTLISWHIILLIDNFMIVIK